MRYVTYLSFSYFILYKTVYVINRIHKQHVLLMLSFYNKNNTTTTKKFNYLHAKRNAFYSISLTTNIKLHFV